MKLNLGCGPILLDGYLNCDMFNPQASLTCNALKLPFKDNSIEEICSYHLIEHFDFRQGFELLNEWCRVLRQGGAVLIECPNFDALCRKYIELPPEEKFHVYQGMFGMPWYEGMGHKFVYSPDQLAWHLSQCGYENIAQSPQQRFNDGINPEVCMRMTATKK